MIVSQMANDNCFLHFNLTAYLSSLSIQKPGYFKTWITSHISYLRKRCSFLLPLKLSNAASHTILLHPVWRLLFLIPWSQLLPFSSSADLWSHFAPLFSKLCHIILKLMSSLFQHFYPKWCSRISPPRTYFPSCPSTQAFLKEWWLRSEIPTRAPDWSLCCRTGGVILEGSRTFRR